MEAAFEFLLPFLNAHSLFMCGQVNRFLRDEISKNLRGVEIKSKDYMWKKFTERVQEKYDFHVKANYYLVVTRPQLGIYYEIRRLGQSCTSMRVAVDISDDDRIVLRLVFDYPLNEDPCIFAHSIRYKNAQGYRICYETWCLVRGCCEFNCYDFSFSEFFFRLC